MTYEELKVGDIIFLPEKKDREVVGIGVFNYDYIETDSQFVFNDSIQNLCGWRKKMKETKSAFDEQVDGSHYSNLKIQPMEYCLANNLNYGQSNAIKYITRYKNKNGKQDLEKAIHCLQLLMEYEYGN